MAGFFQRLRAGHAHALSEIYKRAGVLPAELQKQVAAVGRIAINIYEVSSVPWVAATKGSAAPPMVLNFQLPDSRFRYMIFCLSTVHAVCSRKMQNPDAVFKACVENLIRVAISDHGADGFITGPFDPQEATDAGMTLLKDFRDRWVASLDMEATGNPQAAVSLLCSMLRDTESLAPAVESDESRLLPLACWIVSYTGPMEKAFVELSR